jgi:hypothetical protein
VDHVKLLSCDFGEGEDPSVLGYPIGGSLAWSERCKDEDDEAGQKEEARDP